MDEDYKKYITPLSGVVILVYVVCCLVRKPVELGDYTSYIGYSGTAAGLIILVYIKWIWKWKILRIIGFESIPVLCSSYRGYIQYNYNGLGKKDIEFDIKQTLFSIKLKMITDINKSYSITGKVIKENDEFVLYYTYITNPHSSVRQENPIQYGTTRIIIEDVENLHGIYWTSSNTSGDVFIKKYNN